MNVHFDPPPLALLSDEFPTSASVELCGGP